MGVATTERWERVHPRPISGLDYFETELSLENRAILHTLGISYSFRDTLGYNDQTATRKQTYLLTDWLTYLLTV